MSVCASGDPWLHAALVSAAKVMRCIQCCLVRNCDVCRCDVVEILDVQVSRSSTTWLWRRPCDTLGGRTRMSWLWMWKNAGARSVTAESSARLVTTDIIVSVQPLDHTHAVSAVRVMVTRTLVTSTLVSNWTGVLAYGMWRVMMSSNVAWRVQLSQVKALRVQYLWKCILKQLHSEILVL